jgi:thiol:disulfide interchange protein
MSWTTLKQSLGVFLGVLLASAGMSLAQSTIPKGDFGFGSDGGDDEAVKISFKASYDLKPGTKEGTLKVTATLAEGWHVYSVTQQKPLRKTTIRVKSDALAEPVKAESFQPDRPAKVKYDKEAFGDTPLEEHEVAVTWSAPMKLNDNVDPATTTLALTISGQVCSASCVPFKEEVTAKFAGEKEDNTPPMPAIAASQGILRGDFGFGEGGQDSGPNITFKTSYELKEGAREGTLKVTALLADGWHVYSVTQQRPLRKTTIQVTSDVLAEPITPEQFKPDGAPKVHLDKEAYGDTPLEEHEGAVTWSAPLKLKEDADPSKTTLTLKVSGQVCSNSCVPFSEELTAKFAGFYGGSRSVEPTTPSPRVSPPLESPPDAEEASTPPLASGPAVKVIGQQRLPFWQAALFAVIGGLILNVMPCVLPVIGLKIIAFAEQAGHSRARVFTLNLWYCAGMLAVFLVLATLAAFLNIGWSDQFKSPTFRYIMLGGVFVMGLSFLGVWEIPIPGFASSDHSQKLQQQEGVAGAFSKGVFTTILATPCSGPFLGGVFFYTVSAPWYETYAIFSCIGLGMALPYLIVGIEPSLVKWLPKPGEWMDTFKQAMGFVMLGTAIYLFQTVQNPGNVLGVLIMLLGLGVACWWIGRVPNYAETQQKLFGWVGGIVMAAVIAWGGFKYFAAPLDQSAPGEAVIAVNAKNQLFQWQPFTPDVLAKAQAEGKTVMIDFTAEWCPNCHYNWRVAINTEKVKEAVERNEVVALIADWTDGDEAVTEKLNELRSKTIPFLAIYPASRPDEVIALPDVISQSQLLKALEDAGPSKTVASRTDKKVAAN